MKGAYNKRIVFFKHSSNHIISEITKSCWRKWILICLGCLLFSMQSVAQAPVDSFPHDPNYYKTYEGYLAGRLYLGRKYTSLFLKSLDEAPKTIKYMPNSKITLGIGATYNWLSINLALGFKFLNQSKENKGETNYIDLQTHIYGRRSTLDFYGQFYHGYYIDPENLTNHPDPYLKPDLLTNEIGLAYMYMANWKRFSARAAMLQSERQLKSAGTFLIGGSTNYVSSSADITIIPELDEFNQLQDVRIVRTYEIGPSAGYAYTFVFLQRFFTTAMLIGNLNVNFNTEYIPEGKRTNVSLTPDYTYKIAAGYSRPRWSLAFTWSNQDLRFQSPHYKNELHTGNMRLAWVYRFVAGPRLLKTLKPIDKVYNNSYRHYMRFQTKLKSSIKPD